MFPLHAIIYNTYNIVTLAIIVISSSCVLPVVTLYTESIHHTYTRYNCGRNYDDIRHRCLKKSLD